MQAAATVAMAKVGEGDARWIVAERADGTNVNAWHWQERDVLPWAKRRLQELLGKALDALAVHFTTATSSFNVRLTSSELTTMNLRS